MFFLKDLKENFECLGEKIVTKIGNPKHIEEKTDAFSYINIKT